MNLMERVATLLRANLNDLIDRAEDPEKMLKQLLLDMENQLLQVKTQVAMALADQHQLRAHLQEQKEATMKWRAKAELAVGREDDELARLALERARSHEGMAHGFEQQLSAQTAEADTLRSSYNTLQQKLQETRARAEMLLAEHRRARVAGRASSAQNQVQALGAHAERTVLGRLQTRTRSLAAETFAERTLAGGDRLEERFTSLERENQVQQMLEELKQRRMLKAG
jgi:phage shock protein A